MKLLLLVLALSASAANAQPVKCVDAKGHVQYIDQGMAAERKLKCEPIRGETQTVPMQPGAIAPRPASPAAGANDAAKRQAAVTDAEAKLAAAKKALADQEASRTGDERNYQRVLDRLKPYQDAVEQAQKDLDAARQAAR